MFRSRVSEICIYRGTYLSSILGFEPFKRRPFPIKIRVIWVPRSILLSIILRGACHSLPKYWKTNGCCEGSQSSPKMNRCFFPLLQGLVTPKYSLRCLYVDIFWYVYDVLYFYITYIKILCPLQNHPFFVTFMLRPGAHYKLFIRGSKRKVLWEKTRQKVGSPENLVVFCLRTNPPPAKSLSDGFASHFLWLYEVLFSWAAVTKRCRKKRGVSHPVCTVGALLTGEDCHHFRDELHGLELPLPWSLVPHIHQSLVCAPKVLFFFGMESRQETKKNTVKIQHPINLVTSQIIWTFWPNNMYTTCIATIQIWYPAVSGSQIQ